MAPVSPIAGVSSPVVDVLATFDDGSGAAPELFAGGPSSISAEVTLNTPIPRRVGAVRATFALVTAYFLAGFAVQHVAGREPFPALRGPSFSSSLRRRIAPEPRSVLEVGFGDRTSEWLAPHALIEDVSYKQRRWVAQALMRAASGPSRGEVIEWFRDALARKFPGRVPSRIRAFTFPADNERRAPARRTLAWEAEFGRP